MREGKTGLMTVCGTPLWTAPEILRGQTYNEAADVYSFSLCLWELWAMSVPFNELGLGAMEVLLQVVNDDKRPTMPADIPPAFAELVSKCWATEPGERPTFADVVADIEVFTEMSGADPGHLCPAVPCSQTQCSRSSRTGGSPAAGCASATRGRRC